MNITKKSNGSDSGYFPFWCFYLLGINITCWSAAYIEFRPGCERKTLWKKGSLLTNCTIVPTVTGVTLGKKVASFDQLLPALHSCHPELKMTMDERL